MRIFRHFETLPEDVRGAVIAIGNFDGVHPGHQAVINEAGLIAHDLGRPWAVLTFEPHPRKLFAPDRPPFRLTPFRAKAREIKKLGVDLLIVQRFNKAFSQLEAKDFVANALVRGFGASHVVSGYDFVFGHNRSGHCDMLLAMGAEQGFGFTAVNAIKDDTGEAYSSTRIRDRLLAGDPRGAAAILGRDVEIEGRVIAGESRGHAIGFPTANIALASYLRPAGGVYAIRAGIESGADVEWRDGVANIGVRPTFGGDTVVLEVYLFDFDNDLYGRRLRVRLIDFLREEKKFDGVEALKAQIALDCAEAIEILQKR
ncbi:MAG: bifunctional riboflavin kinase/FAD synthetase [Proteobacteria bacterium]|nr:bifunctional riboflavin kinase/FAD synthetase [Pseudomonadota bacterium]